MACVFAPSGAICPEPPPEWTVPTSPDSQYGTTAVTAFQSPAASATSPGTVTVTCGVDTWDLGLLACGVEKLRYRLAPADAFQDAPANLIINRLSDTPEFQAVITPAGAAWPLGCPVWRCSSTYAMVAAGDLASLDPDLIGGSGGGNAWLSLAASCGLDQTRCWVNVLDEMTSAPLLPSAPSCVAHGGTVDISVQVMVCDLVSLTVADARTGGGTVSTGVSRDVLYYGNAPGRAPDDPGVLLFEAFFTFLRHLVKTCIDTK